MWTEASLLTISLSKSHRQIKAERVAVTRTHYVCLYVCAGECRCISACTEHALAARVSGQALQQLDTDLYGTTSFLKLTHDALHPVIVTNHHGNPITQLRLGGKDMAQ